MTTAHGEGPVSGVSDVSGFLIASLFILILPITPIFHYGQ
jgi:hypothetical protein